MANLRLKTNSVILAETYTYLRSLDGYTVARSSIRMLQNSSIIEIVGWDTDRDRQTYQLIDEFSGVPLSYADASLLVLSRELRLSDVFSFTTTSASLASPSALDRLAPVCFSTSPSHSDAPGRQSKSRR